MYCIYPINRIYLWYTPFCNTSVTKTRVENYQADFLKPSERNLTETWKRMDGVNVLVRKSSIARHSLAYLTEGVISIHYTYTWVCKIFRQRNVSPSLLSDELKNLIQIVKISWSKLGLKYKIIRMYVERLYIGNITFFDLKDISNNWRKGRGKFWEARMHHCILHIIARVFEATRVLFTGVL